MTSETRTPVSVPTKPQYTGRSIDTSIALDLNALSREVLRSKGKQRRN
jgi:hypothetical protein